MRAIFLCAVLAVCSGYKFLVYSPLFGHSHNNYINKIADTLTEAGHDVTVIMPVMDRHLLNRTGLKMTKKAIIVDPDPRVDHIMKTTTMFSDLWSSDSSLIGFAKMVDTLSDMFGHTCEHLIQQKELLAKLKAEKFDAAIAEPFYYCGFGLLEHLGVKTVISAFSGANIGYVSYLIGEPSSVPSTQAAKPAQQQTIADKMKTIMGSITDWYMFSSIANAESQRLKKYYGEKYSGTAELIGQTSYSFVNSNPYIDFPRPTVSKTVLIGGITVDVNNIEKLDGEWNALLSKRPQTVLISFGTVAKSKDMPNEYKQQLLKVIESLPDVTFIWKYEVSTNMGAHLSNLHLSKWVPQKALLSDKRLSVFITHGGLASSTEVAYLGKPAIFIPLFADQPRNAAMIARHGTAIVLPKENMVSADKIRTAITTVLNDKKYEEKARILGEMLRNQPINPKDLVVKHAEFAARFGPIKNLDPPARHLSVVEYYLLDVFALLGGVLLLIFVSLVYLVRKYCCAGKKHKRE